MSESQQNNQLPKNWKHYLKNWEFKIAIFVFLYFLFSHVVLENTNKVKEKGLKNHLKVIPEEIISYYDKTIELQNIDKLAYMQYATNYDYLNLAILNFIQLRKSNTKIPNLVILYDEILSFYASDRWNNLYQVANHYNITLKATSLIKANYIDNTPWSASFTKFHIFNQDEFDRIVYFDSDSMFINANWNDKGEIENGFVNIDEFFKIPSELEFALPQAYWLNNVVEGKSPLKYKKIEIPNDKRQALRIKKLVNDISITKDWRKLPSLIYEKHKFDNVDNFFANHIMVIKPSKETFNKLMKYINNPFYWSFTNRKNLRKSSDYDMEVLNKYLDNELHKGKVNVGILPHRVYGVLTGEFGEEWHERFVVEPQYLPFIVKKSNNGWNPKKFLSKLKLIHFSDNPIPKPWEDNNNELPYNNKKIFCKFGNMTEYEEKYPFFKPRLIDDCESVKIWYWLRDQFEENRKGLWFAG
ncbi:GNT1 [Candida pseudojiufengensis]|uniref:GNT1 n=1 Tax=Candida pseudojiufengensis TaxID=497109 RepID=UPI002224BF68|nr:GNT1 [Candida pseudojiufengensis]KAI5964798.1 GNT1 [Candida pseudojiufengensis]